MTGAIVMAAVTGAATVFVQGAASPTPPAVTTGPAMPPPGAMPAPDQPIAIINGMPINNKAFYDIMMQVAGMRVFQQVFDLSLVQKACLDSGVTLEGPDFGKLLEDEIDKEMTSMGIVSTPANKWTLDDRKRALAGILQQQGVTQVEYRLGLETRAGLRAMSVGKVTAATQKEIQDAYDAQYGERRTIKIISYPNDFSPVTIKNTLKTAKTPEDACKDLKLSPPAVWVIPKSATVADNVKSIRGVAFDYLKAAGQVSEEQEVDAGNGSKQKVLVILDKIDADTTAANPLDTKLSAEIGAKVFDYKQANWMNNLLVSLRSRASVDIKDPVLSGMFAQMADAIQRAAAAQTQPAGATTAPATLPAAVPATAPAALPSLVAPGTRTTPPATGRGG
jgi:hypothetical protein